jgi:hypothetical protein
MNHEFPDPLRQLPCAQHSELMKRLDHEVFGNGKPGLKQDFNEMKIMLRTAIAMGKWVLGLLVTTLFPVAAYFATQFMDLITK